MRVGGLDLAKRSDFSALVTCQVEAERIVVTRALRLPQERFDHQLEAIAPILGGLDVLVYDAGGVGDAVGEQLPPSAVPVVIIPGESSPVLRQGRWRIGKVALIRNVLILAGHGRLWVAADTRGSQMLRHELEQFEVLPTRRGSKLEARRGEYDDLVLALALAISGVHPKKLGG